MSGPSCTYVQNEQQCALAVGHTDPHRTNWVGHADPQPPSQSSVTHKQAAILVIVGGAVVAIGSFLPWATLTTGLGQINIAGTTGDGRFTLALGAVIAILGFLNLESPSEERARVGLLLLGMAAVVFGAFEFQNVSKAAASNSLAAVGYGIYLVIVGGGAAVVGASRLVRKP